jgi:hypothetical protein
MYSVKYTSADFSLRTTEEYRKSKAFKDLSYNFNILAGMNEKA